MTRKKKIVESSSEFHSTYFTTYHSAMSYSFAIIIYVILSSPQAESSPGQSQE